MWRQMERVKVMHLFQAFNAYQACRPLCMYVCVCVCVVCVYYRLEVEFTFPQRGLESKNHTCTNTPRQNVCWVVCTLAQRRIPTSPQRPFGPLRLPCQGPLPNTLFSLSPIRRTEQGVAGCPQVKWIKVLK